MADLVFLDYQGDSIMVGGECYEYEGVVQDDVINVPGDVEQVFADCDACHNPSSSSSMSSSSLNSSSSSSGGFVPSLDCNGGTEPSMAIVVTGATGTINWLGQTWTLPADSGVTKEVCPDNYILDNGPIYKEAWDAGGATSLNLVRSLYYSFGVSANVSVGSTTYNKARNRRQGSLGYWSNTVSYPTGFSPLAAVAAPTAGDYRITDDFFSSVTISGITYSWSRGTNW